MPTFPPERPTVWNFRQKAGPTFQAIGMWILVILLSVAAIALAIQFAKVPR